MRYIIVILITFLSLFCFSKAEAQGVTSFGATRPQDTSKTRGQIVAPVLATTDTNKVIGVTATGQFVLRTKANGSTIDTSAFVKKTDTSRSGIVTTYYYVDSLFSRTVKYNDTIRPNGKIASKYYVDSVISNIPTPVTPTLQQVTDVGSITNDTIRASGLVVNDTAKRWPYLLTHREFGLPLTVATVTPYVNKDTIRHFAFDIMPGGRPLTNMYGSLCWLDVCDRYVGVGSGLNVRAARVGITTNSVQFGSMNFSSDPDLPIEFVVNTVKAKITDVGNFGINVVNPVERLEVGGNIQGTKIKVTNPTRTPSKDTTVRWNSTTKEFEVTAFPTPNFDTLGQYFKNGGNAFVSDYTMGATTNVRGILSTNGMANVVLFPSGNTGIRTLTDDGTPFHVVGNTKISGALILDGNVVGTLSGGGPWYGYADGSATTSTTFTGFGVLDLTPAYAFTVGNGDLFGVGSDGKIKAYGGVTPPAGQVLVGDGTDMEFSTVEGLATDFDETDIITADRTLTPTKIITFRLVDASAGNVTITLNATRGQLVKIQRTDGTANTVTIQGATGQVNGVASKTVPPVVTERPTFSLLRAQTNYYMY